MNQDLFTPPLTSEPNLESNTSQSLSSQNLVQTTPLDNSSTQLQQQLALVGWGLLGLIFFIIFLIAFFHLWRYLNYRAKRIKDWKKTEIIEVAVPKETLEQVQKEQSSKKEDKLIIATAEQLMNLLSEFSKGGIAGWLFGAPRFSLEIIAVEKEIRFWIACNEEYADIIERQIVSIYSKANVTRLPETTFFKEGTVSYIQEMVLQNRFELPFKTYMLMESDPLNTLTSAMGGLEKNESASIQLILTPIKDSWQKKPRKLATKIQQGQNPEEVLNPKFDLFKGIFKILGGLFKGLGDTIFKPSNKKDDRFSNEEKERKIDLTGKYQSIQLTKQQQDIIQRMEEKASKPGFLFTLRIVGSATTEARAKRIVEGIVPAFQIFDIRPFNGLKKGKKSNTKTDALNFLLRAPKYVQNQIINNEEICSIWHLPSFLITTPNIKWLPARKPPIPLNTAGPGEGNVFIGTARAGGISKDIYVTTEDRFRHTYSLGGSGSGKSVLMVNIILQDIAMGNGVCVIDPHGEAVDDILLRMPKERADDVIIFSPAFTDRPVGLNMLETDPLKPMQKTLVIDTLFSIWDKLYDLKKTGGPMFENYMKNAMRLVMSHTESGSTLMEIPKVLSDDDFRAFKLAMCDEPEVVDFWEKEALKAEGEASLANMVPYITSKLAPFVTNDFIKPMVGQQTSAINFRRAMDNKKIILVKLEKGTIGEGSAYLIGMVIVGNLLLAGMGRNDGLKYNLDGSTEEIQPAQRPPFFVYIDEMQNFLFDAIPKALEEIRKYKVGFYLAHQFVKQVISQGDERIKDSIMANCATKYIFRCSSEDAKYLEAEFGPTLTASDIANPEKYTYNAIILNGGQRTTPFNINSMPMSKEVDIEFKKTLINMTKQKYGKPKEQVEKEIRDRAKLLF
jgi:hypothetical protein